MFRSRPLSRQIRDLEDELGIALFEHKAKIRSAHGSGTGYLWLKPRRCLKTRGASGANGEGHRQWSEWRKSMSVYAPSLTVEGPAAARPAHFSGS